MPARSPRSVSHRSAEPQHWVWVFGEILGLRWVLEHKVMAFADHTASRVRTMAAGDLACLYLSRGAFHNPTRDISRLAGLVEVSGAPHAGRPVGIAGRTFSQFVGFKPIRLLSERQGPAILDLVRDLEWVKRPEVWGHYFRTSPIKVSAMDFARLEAAVLGWSEANR